jgi:hypothetical protein
LWATLSHQRAVNDGFCGLEKNQWLQYRPLQQNVIMLHTVDNKHSIASRYNTPYRNELSDNTLTYHQMWPERQAKRHSLALSCR